MTTLIGAGCSFTLGSELADDNDSRSPSNHTWSALLAKQLNMDYCCIAKPGNSNQSIARTLFDAVVEKQNEDLAVAVMWTFTNRYEIFSKDNWLTVSSQTRNSNSNINAWYEICGDSEVYEVYTSLTSYLMIQELLERKNIPYMFTSADVCIFDRYFYKHPTSSIRSLQTEINWDKWVWVGKNKEGFFTWGSRYPIGPYLHPLEEAHEKLANMLLPSAKNLLRFAD
jgi:hypothetical protein